MSYVLVSLVGETDEATQASDAFARWHAKRHLPDQSFHGESPEHAAITAAVLALDTRRGFVLGHGGDTLRAGPGPDPLNPFRTVVVWADAPQFAAMFNGARVYVFACSTLAESNDTESFGRNAVKLGVSSCAGHFKPVQAPDVASGGPHDEQMRRAITRVVSTFLNGCDNVDTLRTEARSALSKKATIPLKWKQAPTQLDAGLGVEWSIDWERCFGSLKVELPSA